MVHHGQPQLTSGLPCLLRLASYAYLGYCALSISLHMQDISMKQLPTNCMPLSAPTDKLASLRAKAIKHGIANPFPKMDIEEFLPPWAAEASII